MPRFVPTIAPRTAEPEADRAEATEHAEAVEAAPAGARPAIGRATERRWEHQQQTHRLQRAMTGALGAPSPALDLERLPLVPEQGREIGAGGKGGAVPAPMHGGAPGAGGKGGVFDEAGAELANGALEGLKPPARHHPYARHKARIAEDLDRLGVERAGTGRVHVEDNDVGHGGAVTRAAVGPTSLAQGAETSLHVGGFPPDFVEGRRSDAQRERLGDLGARQMQAANGELGSEALATLVGDELESTLLDHGDAVAHTRENLPGDGRDAFMNMSWGQSPERLVQRSTAQMLTAPEGSAAYAEAEAILGHPPSREALEDGRTKLDKEEFEAVRARVVEQVDEVLGSEEHRARMDTARGTLEDELAAGREQGLLVFAAAGNEHASATRHGRPDLARSTASGAEGLILVGATDLNGPGFDDDAVADFSNRGEVTVSAAGVDLPVGGPGGDPGSPDRNGTSFASPVALEAAYLADAVNPDLDVNQIADLITDPRALHDIEGTARDGGGQVDHFAVALLARNPDLSRAQILEARQILRGDPDDAEVLALRGRLGLD